MSEFAVFLEPRGEIPRFRTEDGLGVRAARFPDLVGIAAIAAEREGQPLEQQLATMVRFHSESEILGASLLLVAEFGGRPIGFGKASLFRRPPDAPERVAPEGYYLSGVAVSPLHRRRGVGAELTRHRLEWISRRSPQAFYIANERNLASIALHRTFGFSEVTRDFEFPGISFPVGAGVLFRCDFGPASPKRTRSVRAVRRSV